MSTTTTTTNPISPQPTKSSLLLNKAINNNNNNSNNNFILSFSPTPRSTPFTPEDFGFDESDENESIISEVDSNFITTFTPPVPSIRIPTTQKDLKEYFSCHLFYANNLLHITSHFINCEFDSFSNKLILNPDIPTTNHQELLNQLQLMYEQSLNLISTINTFNAFLDHMNTCKATQRDLKSIKNQLDLIIDDYLNVPVHEILDVIIDGLYQYNLTVEDLLEEQQDETSCDDEIYREIKKYHSEIESILSLNDEKFNHVHVEKFQNFLLEIIDGSI
ncbi:LOW QUALITY PROTEIN: hypothetical protein SBY92_003533 [Candida maltosa Xu316]